MMRMTRVVSEIFTQGSFTRPLQKLLPTGLAACVHRPEVEGIDDDDDDDDFN